MAPETDAGALRELADADAAFGTMTPELLAAAGRLRWLQAPAAAPPAGFYFPELIAHPALVTNFREIYNDHLSHHILALMLAFAKQLHRYRDLQLRRLWEPLGGADGGEIFLPDTGAVIVGLGGVGTETARLCKELGMRIVAVDARRTEAPPWVDELHPPERLDTVLGGGDFVILTIPHTPRTEGLFDAAKFRLMKDSAIFIRSLSESGSWDEGPFDPRESHETTRLPAESAECLVALARVPKQTLQVRSRAVRQQS